MKSKRLDLSALCKTGLMPNDSVHGPIGLAKLKNLKSNGSSLVSCPIESVIKIDACKPFVLGTVDYYIQADGIYKQGTGRIYACTFVGIIKMVNLIKIMIIQDSVKTLYVEGSVVTLVNPSGNVLPFASSLTLMNGQFLLGGLQSGLLDLGEDFIAWGEIGEDKFDLTKGNTSGNYNPNIGSVSDIMPMQDSAIVFGSRGAVQMYYAGHVFGFRDLDIPLLKAPHLCASSTNTVIYQAADRQLYAINKNGVSEYLGYGWLEDSVLAIRYLNGRNLFAISTATETYLLDSIGMFSFGYIVYGEFNSSLVVESGFEQTSWGFRTSFSNLGRAGIKALTEVSIDAGLQSGGLVACYGDSLDKTAGFKNLNKHLAVKYPMSGNRIAIEYLSTVKPSISGIQIEILEKDKRFGAGSLPYGGKSSGN